MGRSDWRLPAPHPEVVDCFAGERMGGRSHFHRTRTRGHGHGPITRLMSPSDLGQHLKPFVFLDIFDMDRRGPPGPRMHVHPHSGIATVTVLTQGAMKFEDPDAGTGTLGYGGVEWMRASAGVWRRTASGAISVYRQRVRFRQNASIE